MSRVPEVSVSDKTRSRPVVSARRVAGVIGGLGVGAVGGFVASLLRRRPPTIYTGGVQSTRSRDEESGLPQSVVEAQGDTSPPGMPGRGV